MRQNINSFLWFSKKKKTTGQTEGFDLKWVWIFFQEMVLFLSGVHMWILNGKSIQLLRWSSIFHTCSVPRLGAVCERVWWPLVVTYGKERVEIQRYSRSAEAASGRWPPLTCTHSQEANCIRAVRFWLPAPGQSCQRWASRPKWFSQCCPERESTETLFSLGKLLSAWRVLFACWRHGVWEERVLENHRFSKPWSCQRVLVFPQPGSSLGTVLGSGGRAHTRCNWDCWWAKSWWMPWETMPECFLPVWLILIHEARARPEPSLALHSFFGLCVIATDLRAWEAWGQLKTINTLLCLAA